MTLRCMELDDAERVSSLSTQLGYPMSIEIATRRITRILSLPDHHALVAIEDEVVVGWIHCFVSDILEQPETFVEIGGLVVDEEWHGKSVGATLVKAAEQWTRDRGYIDLR